MEAHPVAVVGVEGELAVDDADLVHRVVDLEEAAEIEVVPLGEDLGRGAVPAAAVVFLEEMDDAVDDALAAAARDVEAAGGRRDEEAVGPERAKRGRDGPRKVLLGEADGGDARPAGLGRRPDREVHAAHLQDRRPQDLRGPPLRLSRALGDDDRGRGPAVIDEDEGPPAGAELDGRLPRPRGRPRRAGGERGEERGGNGEGQDGRDPGSIRTDGMRAYAASMDSDDHHPAL